MNSSRRPKVVVTHRPFPETLELLYPYANVVCNHSVESWNLSTLLEQARDATGLMVFMPDSRRESMLTECRELRIVAAALKGCDNFDVEAMTRNGVWLSHVPDLLTVPTAELGIGLLLALMRHVVAGDRLVRRGAFAGWRPQFYGSGLAGKTAGIIGFGAVGRALAQRLQPFDVAIVYHDIKRAIPDEEKTLGVEFRERDEVLAASDFLFPLTPLVPDTYHLIGRTQIERMKPGAILVNIARGGLVNEEAVAEALEADRLAGYAADVFEMEDWAVVDHPDTVPSRLLRLLEKTLFTPHLGSAVEEVRRRIERQAALNIIDVLIGHSPRDAVNQPQALLAAH